MPKREPSQPLVIVANATLHQIVLSIRLNFLAKEELLTDEASRLYVAQGIICSLTQAVSVGGSKVKCFEPTI